MLDSLVVVVVAIVIIDVFRFWNKLVVTLRLLIYHKDFHSHCCSIIRLSIGNFCTVNMALDDVNVEFSVILNIFYGKCKCAGMVFTFRENLHGCENCPNQDMCRSQDVFGKISDTGS